MTVEAAAEVALGLAEMTVVIPVLVQSETAEPQLVTVIRVVEKMVTVSPSSAIEVAALVVTGTTVVPAAAEEATEEAEEAMDATDEAADETAPWLEAAEDA